MPFEHRERRRAEVEHDVMGVAVGPEISHAEVATDGGRHRRFVTVEIHVRMRRRPRRDDRTGAERDRRVGLRQLLGLGGQQVLTL